ncbi:hypothetical protein KC316_g658 [Hortaea werneckii]|nr:hypothetical protein KC324_g206 [Hortaea werneckii]KAI7595229.1 hypothetical protein KC316_g658 [Hortaea werneckii]
MGGLVGAVLHEPPRHGRLVEHPGSHPPLAIYGLLGADVLQKPHPALNSAGLSNNRPMHNDGDAAGFQHQQFPRQPLLHGLDQPVDDGADIVDRELIRSINKSSPCHHNRPSALVVYRMCNPNVRWWYNRSMGVMGPPNSRNVMNRRTNVSTPLTTGEACASASLGLASSSMAC